MASLALSPGRRDALAVAGVALAARLAVALWAWSAFPAAEDGHYYDVLARRLAAGLGYTWPWPDGTVTFAAHYPVGYPALVALAYRAAALAPGAGAAMLLAALLGAGSAYAAHRVVDVGEVARWRPVGAGLAVALHPGLVAYTPAVMTEGITASLLVVALAVGVQARASSRPWPWLLAAGALLGVATLVRPPSLVLAPVLGALAASPRASWRARAARGLAVTAVALGCVLPWTARNCERMKSCALVSVNAGWNLLIGAQTRSGAWEALDVPPECQTVWDEAGKDACFERAAWRRIAAGPLAWAEKAPDKLGATFDYFGAAPWYLHASNPVAFDDAAKVRLGALDLAASRLFLMGALAAVALARGPRRRARAAVGVLGALAAVTRHAWPGYLALVAGVALEGPRAWGGARPRARGGRPLVLGDGGGATRSSSGRGATASWSRRSWR